MTEIVAQDLEYIFNKLDQSEREKFRGSSVLVTGCAGFLGYYLMQFLTRYADALGIERVLGLDNFLVRKPRWIDSLATQSPRLEIRQFDVIRDDLNGIPSCHSANLVCHMASIASPTFYRRYPIETLDANIWGLRRLLDYFLGKELRGLLFFSSSEIYGDPPPEAIPTNEDYRGYVSCVGPRACYDEAKRFGETICSLFAKEHGMPITVVRPFNNYGPGMSLDDLRVPADFAKAVLENRDIELLSDGTPTRTFCYIADAITGYLKALLHGRYDYFNIGIASPEISVRRLAEIYAAAGREICGYTGSVRFATSHDADYLTDNPNRRCPDLSKAGEILGYRPEVPVEEGVGRFLRFLRDTGGEL